MFIIIWGGDSSDKNKLLKKNMRKSYSLPLLLASMNVTRIGYIFKKSEDSSVKHTHTCIIHTHSSVVFILLCISHRILLGSRKIKLSMKTNCLTTNKKQTNKQKHVEACSNPAEMSFPFERSLLVMQTLGYLQR